MPVALSRWRSAIEKALVFVGEHQHDASLLLFLAAGTVGVIFQFLYPGQVGDEMPRMARNIAEHGTFGNPFQSMPTGPTAVNPPLYPFLLAVLMKLFRSEVVVFMSAVLGSILANGVTAALLPRVSILFYRDVIPGVIASILWLAAMPATPGWDVSYTVAGLLWFCLFTSSLAHGRPGKRAPRSVLGGIICGLLFLLNPSSLLVSLTWIAFLLWQGKSDLRRMAASCGVVLAVLSLFVFAWCGRNYYHFGGFVVRTNLGMTLYSSNNDCAESSMFREVQSRCYQTHHPNVSIQEAELLHQLGEVPYDRKRIADTKNWIVANPAKFLKLTLSRVVDFWFPPREAVSPGTFQADEMETGRRWVGQRNRISRAICVITVLSLPGLLLMRRWREPVRLFVLTVLAIYPLMYYIVVSDIRYRYPVLWLSLLPAGYLLTRLLRAGAEGISTGQVQTSPISSESLN